MRALRLALAAFVTACAPAAPPPNVPPPPPPKVVEAGPVHPARWVLRPDPSWKTLGQLDLGDGRALWVGEAGERWIVAPKKSPEPADTMLPEALVGAVSLGKAGFAIVGRSGHVYRSETALGPVRATLPPPHAVRRVAASKAAIFAITADDRLLRSLDGGETFGQVAVTGDVVAWADVAFSGAKGLLLGMPHRLFVSADDGATFAPLAAGGGATGWLAVDGAGRLLVQGVSARALEGTTLVPAPSPKRPTLGVERHDVRTSFSGTYTFTVENRADHGKKKEWVLVAQRLVDKADAPPPAPVEHPLHAFDHCDHLEVGSLDDVVELACDALVDDGAKKSRGIALHRSTDAGNSFVKDGSAVDAAVAAPVLGPNGYLLLPGKCQTFAPKYFGKKPSPPSPGAVSCSTTWERKATGATLAPSERETTSSVVVLDQGRTHLLAVTFDKDVAVLERRNFDGRIEAVSKLPGISRWLLPNTTLHSDGTRVVVAVADSSGLEIRRSLDGGATFSTHRTAGGARLGVSGQRMVVSGPNVLEESDDGGATFTAVDHPHDAVVLGCNAFGCATSRGLRVGFDLPSAPPRPPPVAPEKRWATPLRCTPTSTFAPLGLGELPQIEAFEPTPSARVAWPRRKEDGSVDVLVVDRAGKTVTHPLLGPAPHGLEDRSQTRVHVQPFGVAALRYSYVRKSPGKYGLSPVDVQLAYLPWATGKVHKVSLPKLGTWRVAHDPAGPLSTTDAYPREDVLAIEGPGLWYRAPYGDRPLRYFQANKPVELLDGEGEVSGIQGLVPFHGPGGHFALETAGTLDVWFRKLGKGAPWVQHPWSLWSIGASADQEIRPLLLDGVLHVDTAFRGDATTPAAHFAVPVEDRAEPGKTRALPLPTDPPRACTDAKGARLVMPAPRGLRHPVVVDGGPSPLVLATDSVVLRGVAGNACEAALMAVPPNHGEDTEDYVAVIRPEALDAVTLYRADRAVWPNRISTRTLSCTFTKGPLPEALAHAPGF